MRFVRENLFLVVLVAIVVVVGAVLVFIDLSVADEVDKQLRARRRVASDLADQHRRLAAKKAANPKIIKAREARHYKYRDIIKAVEDVHVAWNLRRYRVLRLPIYREKGSLLLGLRDVRDWPALLSALRNPEGKSDSHKKMGSRIWELLPEPTRSEMPAPGGTPTTKQANLLLAGLNEILQRAEFFDRSDFPRVFLVEQAQAWQEQRGAFAPPPAATGPVPRKDKPYDLVLPAAAGRILRKRTAARASQAKPREGLEVTALDVQRLNRLVLEAFFPDLIAPCQVPAFPIDKDLYQGHGLQFYFQQQYHEVFADLVRQLEPTSTPSKQEIAAEVDRWTKLKQRLEERQGLLKRKGSELEEPGRPGRGELPVMRRLEESALPRLLPRRRPTEPKAPPRPVAPAEEDKTKTFDPNARGEVTARIRKAREGRIYAATDSFDLVFPLGVPEEASPPDEKLWRAQVGVWVAQDVIAAIIQTNEEVLAELEEKERNVLNAAVKHLVGLRVLEEADKKRGTGRTPARRPELELPPMDEESAALRRPRTVVPVAVPKAPSLTQRIACGEYDIVPYSVILIMPARHLIRLERNLLALNYHTILNVAMAQVPADYRKMYYYGVEPVMLIRIDGELPLLSAWTRGKWDEQAKRWQRWQRGAKPAKATTRPGLSENWVQGEPLMPAEVLMWLAPGARRPEDQRRFEEYRQRLRSAGLPYPSP